MTLGVSTAIVSYILQVAASHNSPNYVMNMSIRYLSIYSAGAVFQS